MKTNTPYTIQAQNATAVNILRSWLRAAGIESKPSNVAGYDLTVTGRWYEVEVQVCMRDDDTAPNGRGIQVRAADFTSKKPEDSLNAFWKITELAGHGKPQPLNRGPMTLNENGTLRKLHYKNEDFLVAICHSEFRRSPNPPEERWQQYRKVINNVTSWFFFYYRELCLRNGYDIRDLKQLARCYVVNFCSRYETANPLRHDNERKLDAYLRQRFLYTLKPIMEKKERSILPDIQTAALGVGEITNEEPIDKFLRLEQQEETKGAIAAVRKDRQAARGRLKELLSALPHDQLVETLQNATNNTFIDPAARKEAGKRLRAHKRECETCKAPLTQALRSPLEEVLEVKEQTPYLNTGSLYKEIVSLLESAVA